MADVGLPLILFQLQPALAGVNFEPDTLRAMAAVDGVVAIKEASFDARRFVDTVNLIADLPRPITLLTGNDNFILESFMLGATGALIGFGAVMTREQVRMIEAWQAGRIDEARALGVRVQRLADVVFAKPVGDYRVRLKECLRILGVLESAHVRRPLHADRRRGARLPGRCPRRGRVAARDAGRATGAGDGAVLTVEEEEAAMATEPADVLIVGAGASGGVVALRLAQAGFKVVCLEQGEWLDRADYPGNKLDWELKARKDWATSPNIRGLERDYPIVEDDTPVSPLMYNAVGGSTIIFAGAWPRALPSDFRVRSLDGIADDWPIDYFELLPYFYRTDRQFGVSGLPGDPAYPPDTEDAPMPPLPDRVGRVEGGPRPHEARLALVAGVQLDQLDALRRPPTVRPAEHVPVRLQRGRQGLDRPDPLAEGDRPGRPARDGRARPADRDRRPGPRDRRDLDRPGRRRALRTGEGRRPRGQRDRHAPAAAARPRPWRTRTASPTRPGWSASG